MSKTSKITPVDLKAFYRETYKGSDLQTINNNNPIPHKCTIDNQDFYYYNADLSGLMWLQGNDRRLKYNNFIHVYRKGFSDGLKHLQEQEGIKRRDYNKPEKRELIKKDLNFFLFEREFLPNHKGLQDLMKRTLLRWTEDNIYKQGYYNGLLHSIITLDNYLNLKIGVSETSVDTEKKKCKETALKDFFPTLQPRQIESLQNEFSKYRGIEMACFIHKINKDGHLELIKNSPKKSLSKFCNVFAEMDKNEYEAVRKLFKYDTYILDNENYLSQYKTEEKINTALKVG